MDEEMRVEGEPSGSGGPGERGKRFFGVLRVRAAGRRVKGERAVRGERRKEIVG